MSSPSFNSPRFLGDLIPFSKGEVPFGLGDLSPVVVRLEVACKSDV